MVFILSEIVIEVAWAGAVLKDVAGAVPIALAFPVFYIGVVGGARVLIS